MDIPIVKILSTRKFLWMHGDRLQDKVCSIYLYPISFQNGNSYIILFFSNNRSFCVDSSFQYIAVFHTFLRLGKESGPFWKRYLVSWLPGKLLKKEFIAQLYLSVQSLKLELQCIFQVKLPYFIGWRNSGVRKCYRRPHASCGKNPGFFTLSWCTCLHWISSNTKDCVTTTSRCVELHDLGHARVYPDVVECQKKPWLVFPHCVLWRLEDLWAIQRNLPNSLCPPVLLFWSFCF